MADTKISGLTSLAQASWATNDEIPIVDTSATTTKKTTIADFDSRYPAASGFTAGSVLFKGASAVSQNNAKLFWDAVNIWLGVGTNTQVDPEAMCKLQVLSGVGEHAAYFKTITDYSLQMDAPDGATVMGFLTAGSRTYDINLNAGGLEWYCFAAAISQMLMNADGTVSFPGGLSDTLAALSMDIENRIAYDSAGVQSFAWDTTGVTVSKKLKVNGAAVLDNTAIAAADIDWSLGNVFTKTLAANTTFTFSNMSDGQTIVVRLTNTASNYTVTWPTCKWSGGVAPTMTIGAKDDVYTFIRIGSTTYGSAVQNMS
jgi:hypothetical protein